MNNTKIFSILFLTFLFSFIACEKEIDEKESDELLRLEAYVNIHYPEAIKTNSGLYYIIYDEGDPVNGVHPNIDDYVEINYTGINLDGFVFETTNDSIAKLHEIFSATKRYIPAFRKLDNMIEGLKEGLSLIKNGGKAKFIFPSKLAYGNIIYNGLYPFSSVIFDLELIRVIDDPEAYEKEQIEEYINEFYPDAIIDSIRVDSLYFLSIIEKVTENDHHYISDLYLQPTDEAIEEDDVVSVFYQGRFLDGFLFDTNIQSVAEENGTYDENKTYEPISVKIGGSSHIEGFSITLKNLTTYTYAKVIIPSYLAYGELGNNTIPPYSPLIFELDVLGKSTSGTPGH